MRERKGVKMECDRSKGKMMGYERSKGGTALVESNRIG